MNARTFLSGAALVIATAAITTQVVSQETRQPPPPPDMPPEMLEMMEKMTAAGTPGEHHRKLDGRVGKWSGDIKMWWSPDAEFDTSSCTMESKWILDGHYLLETVVGDFGGQAFQGQATVGYDNVAGKYVSTWIDNMSTSIMLQEGTLDTASKTMTFGGEYSCPMAGKRVKGRTVERWIDADTYVTEMYGPYYKTGREYKSMEITFKRVK